MTMLSRYPVLSGIRQSPGDTAGTPAFRLYTLEIPDFERFCCSIEYGLNGTFGARVHAVPSASRLCSHLTRTANGRPEKCVCPGRRHGGRDPVKDGPGENDAAESSTRQPRTLSGDRSVVLLLVCRSIPGFRIYLPRAWLASLGRPLGTCAMQAHIEKKWPVPPTS